MEMIEIAFEVLFDGLNEETANMDRDEPQRMQTQKILNIKIKQIIEWHVNVLKYVSTFQICIILVV